jgi:hypothetical protein
MTAVGQWHALPRRSIAVRFTPVSGINSLSQALPGRAITGREQVQQCKAKNYSVTSSASSCNEAGTSMPSSRAVCRLMTSSNLVDCWTGRSEGFAPCRI